jgi:hypothetical protein
MQYVKSSASLSTESREVVVVNINFKRQAWGMRYAVRGREEVKR